MHGINVCCMHKNAIFPPRRCVLGIMCEQKTSWKAEFVDA